MNTRRFLLCISIAVAMAVCGCGRTNQEAPQRRSSVPETNAGAPRSDAMLEFSVHLDGKSPVLMPIRMDADRKCRSMHKVPVFSQTVEINKEGMLRNVFIYIKQGLGNRTFPSPTNPVVLTQHECMYEPHVLGIMVNQPLEIINEDPVLHNIHALPKMSRGFNIAQPLRGMKMEKSFAHREIMVPVKCEVHSWMRCYIGVLDNPYFAVTDSGGRCELKGLPAGSYVVSAWHEKYGSLDQNITLSPGESKKVEFRFSANG